MDFSLFLTCNNVARITSFYNLLSTVDSLFQSISHFEGIQAVLAIFAGLANVERASAVEQVGSILVAASRNNVSEYIPVATLAKVDIMTVVAG